MKSLFKTVALITFFSALTRVLGFLFRIILSRVVGAEGVGMYQVAFSVFMVLLTIISSGIPLVVSRLSASYIASKEKRKESSMVVVALVYTLILSIVLCLVVLIFKNIFAKLFTDERCLEILIMLLPSLIFSAVYSVLRGALWGRGNYFALCITELYEQVVRIILAVLVINSCMSALENALHLSWTMNVACLLSMIFVLLLFFFYGGSLKKEKGKFLRPIVAQSTPITLMRVAGSLIQPLIAFILPARLIAIGFTSSQALSLYGVAVGMTMPLLFIPNTIIGSLSTALVPDISSAMAQNNSRHIEKRVESSINFTLFISAIFIPIFLGMGELLGIFLYDNVLSGTLLQFASWVLIPLGISNITSSILNSLQLEKKSFINFVIGAFAMIGAIWILPQWVGINALVWGFGINYLITAVLNLRLLKKYVKVKIKIFPSLVKIVCISIPASALTAFVVSLCEYVFPIFFSLVIGAGISVASFILLAGVVNFVDLKTILVFVKNKINLPKVKKKAKTSV